MSGDKRVGAQQGARCGLASSGTLSLEINFCVVTCDSLELNEKKKRKTLTCWATEDDAWTGNFCSSALLLLIQVTADINARPGFQDKLHPPFVFSFFTASFLMSQVIKTLDLLLFCSLMIKTTRNVNKRSDTHWGSMERERYNNKTRRGAVKAG